MPEPIDLDRMRADREALALQPIPLMFGGDELSIPHYSYWPAEAQEALVLGDLRRAFEEILGPAQFDKFWSHHPQIGDMNDLLDEIDRRVMDGRGNLRGSSSSSRSTGAPSSQTSGRSTASTSRRPSSGNRGSGKRR